MISLDESIDNKLERETVSAFEPTSIFPEGTAHQITPRMELQDSLNYSYIVPLLVIRIDGKQYEISKPISMRIYKDEDLIFAENETLGIVGTGEDENEAVHEFSNHLKHFYTYYNSLSWDKVTGDAKRLKEIYENLFVTSK